MGDLRYFSDRFGRARGSIEGTQIPYELLWEHADRAEAEIVYDPAHRRGPLRARRVRSYHGFELDSEESPVTAFPEDLAAQARDSLAEALAAGAAYHRDARENRVRIRELREIYRRSGGATREASEAVLREHFRKKLEEVDSYPEFLEADLLVDPDQWAAPEERKKWLGLPGTVELAGEEWPLDYAIEDGTAVVRIRIKEKQLARISEEEVPELDRPVRWTVLRGKRESLKAETLEEARELAARPRVELRQEGILERDGATPRHGRREEGGSGGSKPRRGGEVKTGAGGRGGKRKEGGGGQGRGRTARGQRSDSTGTATGGKRDDSRDPRRESRGRRRRDRTRGGRGKK